MKMILLIDLIHDRGGPIPDDAQWIARVCGCSTRCKFCELTDCDVLETQSSRKSSRKSATPSLKRKGKTNGCKTTKRTSLRQKLR